VALRKYLLLPLVLRTSWRAPRDQREAWERYWSEIGSTGPQGQVLWDAGVRDELDATVGRLRFHGDMRLPVVDLGCGNGRQARQLAAYAPRVIGLDASESAVKRATEEADGVPNVEFRVADIAEPGFGARLRLELGDANVHLRGVLHQVDPAHRAAVVANAAALVGRRGVVHLCETAEDGDPLDFLAMQGATPRAMPDVVRRLVAAGVRPPRSFGAAELARCFPDHEWRVLVSGPAPMYGVPLAEGGELQKLSGHVAVLRRR
jgi:SAM-dependent methyltransferase